MEKNVFTERLIAIKNDMIGTINAKVKAALDGKGDTIYIELNKDVYLDNCDFCDTYISRIEFDDTDEKIVLIDNDDESYDTNDYRISVWALALIADQLNNDNYKLFEI